MSSTELEPKDLLPHCLDFRSFTASGQRDNAYLSWGADDPNFRWGDFFRGAMRRLVDQFDTYPRGFFAHQPFGGDVDKGGNMFMSSDQWILARDGHPDGWYSAQRQVCHDWIDSARRYIAGEWTDGLRQRLVVYLGQLDRGRMGDLAHPHQNKDGNATYNARLHEALTPIRAVPGCEVIFDSANDLATDHPGFLAMQDLELIGKISGTEPRPLARCKHLHRYHVACNYPFSERTDPSRHTDAYDSASNAQLAERGEFYEIIMESAHQTWEHVARILLRGHVPCGTFTYYPEGD